MTPPRLSCTVGHSLRTTLALLCLSLPVNSDSFSSFGKSRHSDPAILQETDPNSRFVCRGPLGEFAACACIESTGEISCINAQFVDADVFLNVNDLFKNLARLTFHGDNFQDLPDRPLFGSVVHDGLRVLNISANYIVNLNSNALKSTPNIRVLDLSNNEIVLRPQDSKFLTHTPLITHLYLRRAFTSTVNRTRQFDLLMQLFENAHLDHLQYLDLSYNYLTSVPYALACPFPSLTFLDLRQNMLKTIDMNTTCLGAIQTFDLSSNNLRTLDDQFRTNFANHLPSNVLILRNSFICDCKSAAYIQWIRSTHTIKEKNLLTCSRASPPNYLGARLVEVPLHKLDCKTNLGIISRPLQIVELVMTTVLLPFVLF